MGRRLRFIPPGSSLVEVTNRTIQGRFLLRPSSELNLLLAGVLGRAQRLYGVKIHACIVLSNHYHLLLTVDSAHQLARFVGYFQGNLAKEAGRLHGWKGPFWHRRYQHVLVSAEEPAQIARLRYILANSCKEDLVYSPREWPGVSSIDSLLSGEDLQGVWIDRTEERLASSHQTEEDASRFRHAERVTFEPLPCWHRLPQHTLRKRIVDLVEEIERETLERHKIQGTRPMGVSKVLGQDPHNRPRESKWSPAPLFHCASKEARDALQAAHRMFVEAFRQVAERLRYGDFLWILPEGSFPPPVPCLHRAREPG